VPPAPHLLRTRSAPAPLPAQRGRLVAGGAERFAFYRLEHCLDILGWTRHADPEYFAQAQRLIEHVLDGGRLRLT
jgi:hypothetical protein